MIFCKRLTAMLCAVLMITLSCAPVQAEGATMDKSCLSSFLICAPSQSSGAYYGSYPPADLFLMQSRAHTCTLIAATMMLRNYSCQRGNPYQQVTDTGVGRFAWTNEWGLAQNFTIGQVSVTSTADIHYSDDKKAYLIQALKDHREGVVIYDTGMPHAIWLFGYDEGSDTFYCADTTHVNGGHAIPLEKSIIRGKTQQDKIDTIDKIWYVK